MGVFKWLRRDRVSMTSRTNIPVADNIPEGTAESVDSPQNVGTIRTDAYKRSLAEFQARRLSGNRDAFQTPDNRPKKKSARHSLPVSCTKCSNDVADASFNYEKNSAKNYEKSKSRRSSMEERVPNVQFLFSNQQVFMPGNIFTRTSYSEVQRASKRNSVTSVRSQDYTLTRHQIDFDADDGAPESPPLFFKNNCLPFEVSDFLDTSPTKDDSISELKNIKYQDMPQKDEAGDNQNWKEASGEGKGDQKSPSGSGCEARLEEVMDELRDFDEWADEQLRLQSINTGRSDESQCDISYYGLPVVASSAIDITEPKTNSWEYGHWGIIPVHVKKLGTITLEQVKRKQCVEVNILRKFRHPNIMLLMGLYADTESVVHIICERCVSTLHTILHLKANVLSAQMSVSYASGIASALVFLHMQGYIHTDINSANIMVTHCGVAKLADLHTCTQYPRSSPRKKRSPKHVDDVNQAQCEHLNDVQCSSQDRHPAQPSEAMLPSPTVAKPYSDYANSETFRWHPPELFQPDVAGLVYPCSKSDVYALCLVLWECCNAALPWQSLGYAKLSDLYLTWKTGIRLPRDGSYPGCLLELLQSGLQLQREKRSDLHTLAERLLDVKSKLSGMEDILIPERLARKRCEFSTVAWETNSMSDMESRASSVKQVSRHAALIHRATSESSSHREDSSPDEGVYEVYKEKISAESASGTEDDQNVNVIHGILPQREYSSNCSTPLSKKRVTLREIGTPGEQLHKSDSTEYCTLFSPENRNLDVTDDGTKDADVAESCNTKLSRSFTPKSYKSLQITIPPLQNLENLKYLKKGKSDGGTPTTYNFDIKDYSLPTTPIARSNKLRKNAWLSGDVPVLNTNKHIELKIVEDSDRIEPLSAKSAPDLGINETEKYLKSPELVQPTQNKLSTPNVESPESLRSEFDTYCDMKRSALAHEYSFETDPSTLERCRSHSWSYKSQREHPDVSKTRMTEDVLNAVNVKPLVAIHERWISEANSKSERSFLSPEGYRRMGASIKPASHSVDPLQTSIPQLSKRQKLVRSNVTMSPTPSYTGRRGSQSDQYIHAREKIARSMSFSSRDPDRYEYNIWSKENSKCMTSMKNLSQITSSVERVNETIEQPNFADSRVNVSTNTSSLDDFVKQLIKREFYQLLNQTSDDNCNDEELIQKGTNNVMNALKADSGNKNSSTEPETSKTFSRVKINGNNKPLIQITFNKSGENSLQVLDSCVNVTICDGNSGAKMDKVPGCGEEQYSSKDDLRGNSLKRCQAFSSIQEARSTEDLYIDDDLSTHMEENFGGNMKLIPLHGSLHEILCEKADDCCLIKVKQENGCDKMYFMYDNLEHASRDSVDGTQRDSAKPRDKVVFKRSISLIEERFERFYPKEKKYTEKPSAAKARSDRKHLTTYPAERYGNRSKTEVYYSRNKDTKVNSRNAASKESTNGEIKREKADRRTDEDVVNLEHLMSYQDSSSDESLKGQNDVDDFEEMEKRVEEDLASVNTSSNICGFLEKISEENLSVVNDEAREELGVSNGGVNKLELDDIFTAELRKTRSCEQLL